MAWAALTASIVLEVLGTSLLKLSHGFTRPLPAVCSLLAFSACFALAAIAMRSIPLGVVYAIWAGCGIALVTVIAVLWFGEAMTGPKLLFIAMILVGAVGLRVVSGAR